MQENLQPNKIILELLKLLKKPSSLKVLDLCCGQGQDSVYLSKLGFDLTSVDNWSQAINDTIQLAKIHNIKINTKLIDINNLQFKEKFDIIVCNNSLHLFNKSEVLSLIKLMKSNTNDDGINVITSFTLQNPPKNYSSLFSENELKVLYSDWKIIYYTEYCSPIKFNGIVKPHSIVEMIAQKPK